MTVTILHLMEEERSLIQTTRRRQTTWMGHILRGTSWKDERMNRREARDEDAILHQDKGTFEELKRRAQHHKIVKCGDMSNAPALIKSERGERGRQKERQRGGGAERKRQRKGERARDRQ